MWYVYVPVLTEDALPCFTDNTSVVFSIPIVAIWKKKVNGFLILIFNVDGYLSMKSTTVSLNMT